MARQPLRITVPAGGRWPEGGTPSGQIAPFWFLRIDNRSAAGADVVVSLDGRAENDPVLYWEIVRAGERVTRNVGKKVIDKDGRYTVSDGGSPPAEEIHFLNLSATVAAQLWVELDVEPIVDLRQQSAAVGGPPGAAPTKVSILDDPGISATTARVAGIPDQYGTNLASLFTAAQLAVLNQAAGTWDRVRSAGASGTGIVAIGDISQFNVESTVALAGAATFTGGWRDTLNYNWFGALALSDVAGTLLIDEADSATPTVASLVSSTASAAVNANQPSPPATTGQIARAIPTKSLLRFMRVRYINGGTIQARFNLQTALSPLN